MERGKRETRSDPCRFVHVGIEGSPAGSQSNKVVRGCFAGCKFSPCGLSVSILLLFLLLFPLSLCNCELSLCTSFRDTRKWPCSRSPIHNPLLFRVVTRPFAGLFILILSTPDHRRITIVWNTYNQLRAYIQQLNPFVILKKNVHN